MEKLTINHLSPYLPYSLKVIMEGKKCNVAWMSTKNIAIMRPDSMGEMKKINWEYAHLNIKPILRPLSDLTKEIEINGDTFNPLFQINNLNDFGENLFIQDSVMSKDYGKLDWWTDFEGGFKFHEMQECYNTLLEWHFDVFGLIEKGLAVDYNTLKP